MPYPTYPYARVVRTCPELSRRGPRPRNVSRKIAPCSAWTGSEFVPPLLFPVTLFLGNRPSVIQHFVDAARAPVRSSVIEDAKQMTATARERHRIPTLPGVWMARESNLQNGWQLPFCIHDGEQAFRNLFRPAHPG